MSSTETNIAARSAEASAAPQAKCAVGDERNDSRDGLQTENGETDHGETGSGETKIGETKSSETASGKTSTGTVVWGFVAKFASFLQTVGVAFGIVAVQMAQGILLARLLGPEGRGQYATAILYSQLFLYIGLFGGLEVVCRYAAEGKVDKPRLRRAAMWLGLTTGGCTTILVLISNGLALPTEKQFLMPLGCLCAMSVIGQHVMLIMTAVDRGASDYTTYNIRRFIAAAAFPALLLIAALVTKVTLLLACMLFVASSLVSIAACVIGLPQPVTGPSDPPVKALLTQSRPYALSSFASDLFERLDLMLVMWFIPLVHQGFYAAMVPVVYPLIVIPNTLGIFLFNAGADGNKNLTTRDVHRILGGSIVIQTASTIAFMLLVGPLVRFVYGEEFAPAVVYALWLAPVSAIRGILQGLDSYVKGRGRPLVAIRCRVAAAAVMLVVAWWYLPSQGALAIAKAALVGQVVCLLWLSAIVYSDVSESNTPVS